MGMLKRAQGFASKHASWFSGAWFSACALLLVSPLAAMTLMAMVLEAVGGGPLGGYLWMLLASALLPLAPAFVMGALAGPRILRLPDRSRARAAGWGAAAALGALVIWFLLLEGLSRLVSGGVQTSSGSSDVPGAAVVVGYVVFIPLIVTLPVLAGAVAGVLLQALGARSKQALYRKDTAP
jgi:hypothetical protein